MAMWLERQFKVFKSHLNLQVNEAETSSARLIVQQNVNQTVEQKL